MEIKVGDYVKSDMKYYTGNRVGSDDLKIYTEFFNRSDEYIIVTELCKNILGYFRLGDFKYHEGIDHCMFQSKHCIEVAKKIKNTKIARKLNQGNIIKEEKEWIWVSLKLETK